MQVSLDHNDPKMPQTLQTYLDKELIKNAKRSGTSMERKYTSLSEGRYRDFYGLVSWLKNRYYPHYTHSRRRYGNGMRYETKGSSKGKGNRVDRELSEYIVDQTVKGKKQRKRAGKRKRTVDPLTDGVLKFWKAKVRCAVLGNGAVLARLRSHLNQHCTHIYLGSHIGSNTSSRVLGTDIAHDRGRRHYNGSARRLVHVGNQNVGRRH